MITTQAYGLVQQASRCSPTRVAFVPEVLRLYGVTSAQIRQQLYGEMLFVIQVAKKNLFTRISKKWYEMLTSYSIYSFGMCNLAVRGCRIFRNYAKQYFVWWPLMVVWWFVQFASDIPSKHTAKSVQLKQHYSNTAHLDSSATKKCSPQNLQRRRLFFPRLLISEWLANPAPVACAPISPQGDRSGGVHQSYQGAIFKILHFCKKFSIFAKNFAKAILTDTFQILIMACSMYCILSCIALSRSLLDVFAD